MPEGPIFYSVVVPMLNEERWIGAFLQAMRAQTLPRDRFELIVVDNDSTDESVGIVERDGQANLLTEPRRDPYLARNRGIAAAKGSYIVFFDADCLPDADCLEQYDRHLSATGDWIAMGYLAFARSQAVFLRRHEEYYDAKFRYLFGRPELSRFYFGHGGNMVVARKVFDLVGDFQPMPVVGDTEILHRLLEKVPEAGIGYVPAARVHHAEIESFANYLLKLQEAGEHSKTCEGACGYRVLPGSLKAKIFAFCIWHYRYGPWRLLTGILALSMGWVSFARGHQERQDGPGTPAPAKLRDSL